MRNGEQESTGWSSNARQKRKKNKKNHNLYWHLRRAAGLPRVYKLRERRDVITFSHCAPHSSPLFNSSGNVQALGKRSCHTTLSLSSKDRLFCNATVLCDKQLIFTQPPLSFFSFPALWLWLLFDISGCLFFCSLLPLSEKVFAPAWPAHIVTNRQAAWAYCILAARAFWAISNRKIISEPLETVLRWATCDGVWKVALLFKLSSSYLFSLP